MFMGHKKMMVEPALITARVTAVLEKLKVRYLIGGSLASTLHGMVRTTQDSDLVADLRQEHVGPFLQLLQDEFYIDDQMIAEAIARQSSFNIVHRESFFKVDVFIPKSRPFIEEQFARARKETLSTEPVVEAMVATAEDTLLAKLEWFRMGGEVSERQWRDVLGILEVQAGNLDLIYLQRWAQELKVSDLLALALDEGNLPRIRSKP
jgi:hypothetical protein